MSRNAKILIDLAVLAAVYGIWLLPKWRPLGRRTLAVYTLMYGCLAGIALFTLMPVLAALPFCLDHPYIPMHMAPFEDVILRHGDYVRQIVLNIALFVPFGVLLPLCRSCRGKRCSFWRCLLLTLALSVGIEVVQPLLHAFRSSDITDVITNTTGGALGDRARLPEKTERLACSSIYRRTAGIFFVENVPLFRYTITNTKSGILRSKTEKKQKSEERTWTRRSTANMLRS